MRIFIGADHRGFRLKEQLKVLLEEQGYEVVDGGNTVHDPDDDYPDFVLNIAKQLQKAPEASRGILICGSGVGVDIAANKFAKIRSVLATNPEQAAEAREHENVNVVSLSADHISLDEAQKINNVIVELAEEMNIKRDIYIEDKPSKELEKQFGRNKTKGD